MMSYTITAPDNYSTASVINYSNGTTQQHTYNELGTLVHMLVITTLIYKTAN